MSDAATGARKRILVTDDDPAILRLVTAILRRANYEVDTATNGREALEKMERTPYDVAVLDLMMPDVTGLEVLASLQARNLETRFVVIMSAASPSMLESAEDLHAFAALRKPFNVADLIATVRACIAEPKSRSAPGPQA